MSKQTGAIFITVWAMGIAILFVLLSLHNNITDVRVRMAKLVGAMGEFVSGNHSQFHSPGVKNSIGYPALEPLMPVERY